MRPALKELRFFSRELGILSLYAGNLFRREATPNGDTE
jgi:hypothetical protein